MDIRQRNHVTVLGDAGPTLLYAHGFGCSQDMWRHVTPAFAATHRQVLFDYVGSGQSERQAFDPARYASLDGYAQDLLEVCDALELKQDVVLIAHSVSCSIGLLASLRRPGLFGTPRFHVLVERHLGRGCGQGDQRIGELLAQCGAGDGLRDVRRLLTGSRPLQRLRDGAGRGDQYHGDGQRGSHLLVPPYPDLASTLPCAIRHGKRCLARAGKPRAAVGKRSAGAWRLLTGGRRPLIAAP